MGLKRTDELRKDAVRIAKTRGLTLKQVADDLGVGMSKLNKWITAHRDRDVVSKEDLDLAKENDRLRRENRILKDLQGHVDSLVDCLPQRAGHSNKYHLLPGRRFCRNLPKGQFFAGLKQ